MALPANQGWALVVPGVTVVVCSGGLQRLPRELCCYRSWSLSPFRFFFLPGSQAFAPTPPRSRQAVALRVVAFLVFVWR